MSAIAASISAVGRRGCSRSSASARRRSARPSAHPRFERVACSPPRGPALAAVAGSRGSTPVMRAEQDGRVRHGARHRARGVLRVRDRNDAGAADQPDRRLDARRAPFAPDGQTIDPSVSVPTPTAARFAAIAAPVPELDPHGLRSSAYGFFTCPPRPLQPLVDLVERKFAHSLRLVLPRITAPAARRRSATNASRAGDRPLQRQRPGRRHHAIAGVDVVLDEDRDAVQRPAHAPAFALRVERVGDRRARPD